MGLFRKSAKSGQTRQTSRAEWTVSALRSLYGAWAGTVRDWDPDYGDHVDRKVGLRIGEEDASHLCFHYWVSEGRKTHRFFDVIGLDARDDELTCSRFADEAREAHFFRIADCEVGPARGDFSVILETTSWAEARPCEIRWLITRSGKELTLTTERALIGGVGDFQKVSEMKLTPVGRR